MRNIYVHESAYRSFPQILLAAILLLVCCSSCRSTNELAIQPAPAIQSGSAADQLPGLAQLDKLNTVSLAGERRSGSEYHAASPLSNVIDNSLDLDVFEGQFMYAIYAFDSDPADVLSGIGYIVRDRGWTFTPVYVALADYSSGRWDIISTQQEDTAVLRLDGAPGQYSSPAGRTYVALWAWDEERYTIDSVEVMFANRDPLPAPWPTAGGSNQRQGLSMELVVETANVHWKTQLTGSLLHSAPIQSADGTIYLGSYDPDDAKGSLFALDSGGSVLWEHDALDNISSTPAISPLGNILYGDLVRHLFAINPSGQQAWRYQTSREIFSSPAINDDGICYFGIPASLLIALDFDGTELWTLDTSSGIYAPPALAADGSIYVCTSGGNLLSVNPAGSLNWEFDGIGEVSSGPVLLDSGNPAYGTQDGNVYVVDNLGNMLGSDSPGGSFEAAPAIGADGNIYIGNMDGKLYKYDASCVLLDSFDAGSPLEGSAVIDGDGTVFCTTLGGSLFALNPDLGIQWQYDTDDSFRCSLTICEGGMLLAPTVSGSLIAFAPNDPVLPAVPVGLTASEGLFADKVRLSWDEQFDATGFEIYRDAGPDVYASVGYVTEWFDEGLVDDTVHEYTIRAINETGSSADSEVASGYANAVAPGAGEWNMFAGDAANSGQCSLSGPHTRQLAWSYDCGTVCFGSPVIGASGEIYVPTGWEDPRVLSVSAEGTFRWEYDVTNELSFALAIDEDGYVYGAEVGRVFRLKPDGTLDWSTDYTDCAFGAPTLTGDSVVICGEIFSGPELVVSLARTDGSENWNHDEGSRFCAPAVGSGGLIHVSSGSNRIYVLNPDGTENSERGGSGTVEGSPVMQLDAINGDTLLFVSGPKLYVYLDSTYQYFYPADSDDVTGMAFLPDGLSYYTIGDECSRVELDGDEIWSEVVSEKTEEMMPVVDADGYVYYGGIGSILRCIDPDGNQAWEYDTGTDLRYSTPAIGPGNRLYILGENGTLFAFEPAEE